MKFLCYEQKLPDPFPLLRNRVWPRKTTLVCVASYHALSCMERENGPGYKARVFVLEDASTVHKFVCTLLTCDVMSCLMKCSRSCPSWWARQFSIMASTFSGGLGKYSNQCEHQFTVCVCVCVCDIGISEGRKTLAFTPPGRKSKREPCPCPSPSPSSFKQL